MKLMGPARFSIGSGAGDRQDGRRGARTVATAPWRVALLLFPLALLLPASGSHAIRVQLTKEMRARALEDACQFSSDILVARIDAKEGLYIGRDIYTRYRATAMQVLKGDYHTDDTLSFVEVGGKVGDWERWVEEALRLPAGRQYLVFLAPCGDRPFKEVACSSCFASFADGMAWPVNPHGPVSFASLADSIRRFVAATEPESLRASASACIEAHVPQHSEGSVAWVEQTASIVVDRVLWQREGAPFVPGSIERISLPTTPGRKLSLKVGADYLLLFDGSRGLLPSLSSAWLLEDSTASVLATHERCNTPSPVLTMPLRVLLQRLRN